MKHLCTLVNPLSKILFLDKIALVCSGILLLPFCSTPPLAMCTCVCLGYTLIPFPLFCQVGQNLTGVSNSLLRFRVSSFPWGRHPVQNQQSLLWSGPNNTEDWSAKWRSALWIILFCYWVDLCWGGITCGCPVPDVGKDCFYSDE